MGPLTSSPLIATLPTAFHPPVSPFPERQKALLAVRLLNLTLPTPAENLALDEALLLDTKGPETLRFWEPREPLVVLGRSSRCSEEVDTAACEASQVPLLRRVSGGATIVTGPGCLMYAVVLDTASRPELKAIDRAHTEILTRLASALKTLEPTTDIAGTSDLAFHPNLANPLAKFSGNSLRVVRSRLLYHGTLLYDFNLPMIPRLLRTAPRQPTYRDSRTHEQFVANFPATEPQLREAISAAWSASNSVEKLDASLTLAVEQLVRERYGRPDWNLAR